MIPYRRQRAIEAAAPTILAADVAPGDVILIRQPGQVERSALTVLGVKNLPGKRIRFDFEGFSSEHSNDVPVAVQSFTKGSWRQAARA